MPITGSVTNTATGSRIVKNTNSSYLTICFCFLVLGFNFSQTLSASELSDQNRVVIITAQQLPNLNTYKLSEYSLAAVSNKQLQAIPYQFDEIAENGYVHIEASKTKILGKANFFDEHDQLLFMYRDAGKRKTTEAISDGKLVAELEINLPDKKSRYVYVIQGARILSDKTYIRYSAAAGRAESDYYSLKVDEKNAYMWEEFYFNAYDGEHAQRPIDTIKIYIAANVLPAGGIKVKRNNKHLVAKVIAEKTGPIRATTSFRAVLTFAKLPLLNSDLQIHHYESKIAYDALVKIPAIRRQALANLEVRLSMDGNALNDAEMVFSNLPDQTAIVDGEISDLEKNILSATTSETGPHWSWIDSKNHFSMLSVYRFEQVKTLTLGKVYKNKVKVKPWLEDDFSKKIKPEYYKGQAPNIGYSVKMPKFGQMRILGSYDMYKKGTDIAVAEFAKEVLLEPEIKVH